MNEQTVFTIATMPDYWGDATEQDALACARHMRDLLQAHCERHGYEVEFRLVEETYTYSNRPTGDEAIIEELTWLVENWWQDSAGDATHLDTTAEAGVILGVSVRRVQRLIQDGRLPATKQGRDYLIRRADLEAFAARPRPAGRPKQST